jgi:hypothetical protein
MIKNTWYNDIHFPNIFNAPGIQGEGRWLNHAMLRLKEALNFVPMGLG